jgi:translation initiation factor 3 subunit F
MAAVNLKVKVHPVVLFQIADSYERRSQDNHRVIGTLVGSVDKQSVEVTNCFCIPHKEYEERVEADIVYAQEMFELNKKVAPHEQLIGWFATGSEITSHSALIHDYYARETKDPIHLTLDTTLTTGRITMKAYVFVPLGVPGATSGSMFTPVVVELVASEPEIAGLDVLHKTKFSKVRTVEPVPELTKVAEAASKMQVMLDAVIKYVEAVMDGQEEPNTSVGRLLNDLVRHLAYMYISYVQCVIRYVCKHHVQVLSVPKMDPDQFELMLNSNVRDLLMVVYLSQMTKTQLQLNEKLSMVSVNNLREVAKLLPAEER